MRVEERAFKMRKYLEQVALESKQKVHLVTYSASGIDARVALSIYGGNEYVETLTTIVAPHGGYKIVDDIKKHNGLYKYEVTERAFEILGLSNQSIEELSCVNM